MGYVSAGELEVGMETAEGFIAEVVSVDDVKTYVYVVADEDSLTDTDAFVLYDFRSDELLEVF